MPKIVQTGRYPTPKESNVKIDKFRGVDLSSSAINVHKSRSPWAINMMPDMNGFPVKRPGYHTVLQLDGRINGQCILKTPQEERELIHAGTKLYLIEGDTQTVVYSGMNDLRSRALQMNSRMWIWDGKTYLVYGELDNPAYTEGGTEPKKLWLCKPVTEIAYVPEVIISAAPTGGGKQYNPINMLSGKRTHSALGVASTKVYQLSEKGLDATPVAAKKLNSSGEWLGLVEGTDFSVDRALGRVTFTVAPGAPPVVGEDNIKITYSKTSNADKINKCDIAIMYGVNGASDRFFVTGNPDSPNQDYYSQINDPTYFGDLWYSSLGQDSSEIIGYSIVADQLAAHKATGENGRNIIMRYGTTVNGQAAFPISTSLQGESTISKYAFAYLQSEPLFLTAQGVFAITAQDITGERYGRNRSYYINKKLNAENERAEAVATIVNGKYVLVVNGVVYLLDGNQPDYTKDSPQSAYKYECYIWDNVPARTIWTKKDAQGNDVLYFGTADGKIKEFYAGKLGTEFNDDGDAIKACWLTPMLDFDLLSHYKTVTGVWLIAQPFSRSSGDIYYITNKDLGELRKQYTIDILDWNDIDFNRWTFNTVDSPQVQPSKAKAKKITLFQVKIENKTLNESFGLYELQINYRIGSKVR